MTKQRFAERLKTVSADKLKDYLTQQQAQLISTMQARERAEAMIGLLSRHAQVDTDTLRAHWNDCLSRTGQRQARILERMEAALIALNDMRAKDKEDRHMRLIGRRRGRE